MSAERGVIYVATGDRYNAEARRSVRSLRVHHPGLPVTLFSDRDVTDDNFDDVQRIEAPSHDWSDKITPLVDSPYERTIFLDTDTYICSSLDPVFRVLDRFELAIAHDTVRADERWNPHIPTSFPELNTGVLAYRLTPDVRALLAEWRPMFDEFQRRFPGEGDVNDQQSLRLLLWERDVRFGVVPAEFNLRIWCPNAIGTRGVVTVLHSHADDLDRIASLVNRSSDARVVLPTIGHLSPHNAVILTRRGSQVLRLLGRVWPLFRRGVRSWSKDHQ